MVGEGPAICRKGRVTGGRENKRIEGLAHRFPRLAGQFPRRLQAALPVALAQLRADRPGGTVDANACRPSVVWCLAIEGARFLRKFPDPDFARLRRLYFRNSANRHEDGPS